jgi:hypothetical protein
VERAAPISDDVMVLAFLKAEVDSRVDRVAAAIQLFLERRGRDRSLIDDADLADDEENRIRREVLADLRGFGRNALLFASFPPDVTWHRGRLTVGELAETKYAGWREWVKLTHGTRVVKEGAQNATNSFYASETIRVQVPAIAEACLAGAHLPELILVGPPDLDELVLLEGHKRATAYVRALDAADELDVILGSSKGIDKWRGWRAFLTL